MSTSNSTKLTGRKTVGTTAAQLTTQSQYTRTGVLIKSSSDNSGLVYFGFSDDITADVADATDGFPLAAGESVLIPASRGTQVYVIASEASQKIWWAVL